MQTLTVAEFKKRYDVNFRARNGEKGFIGSGGYGSVYQGYSYQRNHEVAIKKSATKNNLLDEVEKARIIPHHPNIARYIEGFRIDTEADDFDVAILQYYEKGNLDQLISKHNGLTDKQLEELVLGILNGLAFLHNGLKDNKGKTMHLIHRDLKPQNILISEYKGRYIPLITDFGISKVVADNSQSIFSNSTGVGTIAYKAPEQIEGGKIKTNLDLWAFGVVLFKMLKGYLPFRSSLDANTDGYYLDISKKITSADLSDIFDQLKDQSLQYQNIVKRCLVRNIDERAQSAQELITILQDTVQATSPIEERTDDIPTDTSIKPQPKPTPPPKPKPFKPVQQPQPKPTPPPVKEEPSWLKIVAIVLGLALFGGIVFNWLANDTPKPTPDLSVVKSEPLLNADSLFEATKTAFLEQGMNKNKALTQFKQAVAAKPALAKEVSQVFKDKAQKLKDISPELGKEYEELSNQFEQ